jgi:hypothetical protein
VAVEPEPVNTDPPKELDVDSASVVFSKVSGLVENPVFQAVLPILVSTFAKLDANPAATPVLGAQFMADVLPFLGELDEDVLTQAVNLFSAILAVKQPVEAPPAITGSINTSLQNAGAAVV